MKKPYTLLNKAEPYFWILPSIILMTIFIIVPIGFVFRMAFSQVTKAGLVKGFIGFKNFEKVLGGAKFGMVLKNTVVWTLYVVILSTILGFILALLLNNEFKGRKIARAIVVFPWATTLIFIFINAWNEYTVALCLISTDTIKPMTVGINIFNGYNIIEWQYLFAASIFAIVPVVILFMSIEKNLTSGLTAGGVKG